MYNKPKPMDKKKKIELVVLVVAILWFIILGINYLRYTQNKALIFAIHTKTSEDTYADGYVEEYLSLGYIYRIYNRVSISREEFVPFWVARENPKASNDLPQPEKEYNIPDNKRKEEKYMGLLYFYSTDDKKLLGTYKCINSSQDCEYAMTGTDRFDILNVDPITARDSYEFATLYDKYAFIDDSASGQSVEYGENGYVRTIYLYQFDKTDPKVLARFSDIKETEYDDVKERANVSSHLYIVKDYDTQKWGIIKVLESGTVEVVLSYEYDSINYDYDTGYYIVSKDNVWYAYDLDNKKQLSAESVEVIYDIWENNNNTYYFKIGRERTVGNDTFMEYSIYKFDGTEFLKQDRISEIIPRTSYVMYTTSNDNVLHFMTYSKQEKVTVQLAFSQMKHDEYTHPAFDILHETDKSISIKVYQGRELKYDYDVKTVFTYDWSLNDDD